MDNTYISLKKILNIMIPEKYPMVSDIKVVKYHHFKTPRLIVGSPPNEETG